MIRHCVLPNLALDAGMGNVGAINAAALTAYAVHPEHGAMGARLVTMCNRGADGIVVHDIEGRP